jgi:long-chain fatty acid transport protein
MKNRYTALWAASLTAAVLAALAPAASASNFQLTEQSVTSLGRAHAGGAAAAEDSSSIWYNPAGLTELSDTEIMGGYSLIRFGADFTKTSATDAIGQPLSGGEGGSVGKLGGPAFIYYAQPLSHGLTFGFGVNTPFGLATKYDDDSIFRYQAIYSSVAVINYNPSLAWKVNDQLSLGFGIDYQTMSVKLTNDVDYGAICDGKLNPVTCTSLGLAPQNNDGFFSADASGHGWGWNIGALFKINDKNRVGFSYRSKINHDLSGGGSFTNVPAAFSTQPQFQDQSVSAAFASPATWSLSWAGQLDDHWTLFADWSRTMWSSFDNLTINFANAGTTPAVVDEGLSDSNRYAFGADYRFNETWTFRGGLALDNSPVPDAVSPCAHPTAVGCTNDVNASRTARLPDGDRRWISLGVTWHMTEHSQWDLGYAHLFLGSSLAFDQTNANGGDRIVGTFKADADIFGISYRYKF